MKFLLIALSLLFTGTAIADDYWGKAENPLKTQIAMSDMNVTKDEIIKSIFKPLVANKWHIVDVTKNSITATYKSNSKLFINITPEEISLQEIPTGVTFKERWMESLHRHIEINIKNHHYLRLMKSLQ
ncbi:MAG: hypothetical protein ABW170_23350 [Candidatus Thiodiazotropha sp. L084R]